MKPYVDLKGFIQIVYTLCKGTKGYMVNIGIMQVGRVLEAYEDTNTLMQIRGVLCRL